MRNNHAQGERWTACVSCCLTRPSPPAVRTRSHRWGKHVQQTGLTGSTNDRQPGQVGKRPLGAQHFRPPSSMATSIHADQAAESASQE